MLLSTQDLATGWQFRATSPKPDDETQAAAFDSWHPVKSVPTEVHLDLHQSGLIPDPFVDLNELGVRWVADQQWTYRCRFASPPASVASSSITDLVFQGLDTFATVSLNHEVILESDNMFISHRVTVTDKLRPVGTLNELSITFESARLRGLGLVKEHPEHRHIVHQTEIGRGPVRKAQYQWGWDWGPIMLTCGPWKPVMLETYSVRIEDLGVAYALEDDLSGATVFVNLKTRGLLPGRGVSYEVLIDGDKVGGSTTSTNACGDGEMELVIRTPKLWMPRGYGDQKLYSLEVRLLSFDDKTVLDSATKKIGLRSVELVQEKDSIGQSFYFRINGVDVFCGGSCWIPSDSFLTRTTPAQHRDWILRHVADGNQAMVRVWGGGIYEADAFFDACDEAGVLAWQDFCFACANYPAHPEFLRSVEAEARQNLRRLRHHPCLVIWAGNNEDYQIVERYGLQYDFAGDKDPQSWLRTNFPARYIYEHLLPLVVGEEYGTEKNARLVAYHPSSPWGDGTSTTLAVDQTVGDVHQWNVWHGAMRPYQFLPEMGGRFVSEFGMEAYPHVPTLEGVVTDARQRRPGSMAMDFRNKAGGHARRLLAYVGENFDLHGVGGTLEGFAYLTQAMQADAMRAAYRGWRRQWRGRRCGGVLVWQLNDCWPTVSWAVVDYRGVRKPAWYAIRDALRPVAVGVGRRFFDCTNRPADETWQRDTGHVDPRLAWGSSERPQDTLGDLWIANGTTQDVSGRLTVSFVSIKSGKVLKDLHDRPLHVVAKANDITELQVKQSPPAAAARSFFNPADEDPFIIHARLDVLGHDGQVLETVQDVSWPDPIKWLDFDDRKVQVSACVEQEQAVLTIKAERPVKGFVIQESPDLTVSDNGFDLVPGYPATVKIEGCADLKKLVWRYHGQVSVGDDWARG
ncbi:uncharacterized protein PpBr36_10055 [Pyricularia pennisetigena]|uniref:uncharacterized protein n=1 Tax=Pyricularia pennisetigena TaxID=1578925 RepID=UPI00114EA68F|nr:uncharacterized protein PpBr36_10055 [Pyricularia pennisetigena]TLS22230.1 hypothetical protein PpBr36_10055 [Pyricularia pennisetigena]